MNSDIFGPGSRLETRLIETHERMEEIIKALRITHPGIRIVLTSGTFDLAHIGHCRYLEKAKAMGDLLVVGVDDDEKTRSRKGPKRPVVPEMERVEMLVHMRSVDLVFLKRLKDEHLKLTKIVRPDILIITKRNDRPAEEVEALREFCGEVVSLESQAITSTTNRIRLMILNITSGAKDKLREIEEVLGKKIGEVLEFLDKATEK